MRRDYVQPNAPFEPRPPVAGAGAPIRSAPQCQAMAREIGRFFQDLRGAFRATQAEIAKRLATRPDIIAALESGQVRALPPWPEACRIVRTYTGLVGLDPRPVLHSIEMLLAVEHGAPAEEPRQSLLPRLPQLRPRGASAPAETSRKPKGAGEVVRRVWESRFGQAGRALFAVTVPVAIVLLLTQTSVLEAAVAKLPPSVARIVRGAQNYVIVQFAPVRDGMRWIDVPDPRTRRSDKLRTTAQSD